MSISNEGAHRGPTDPARPSGPPNIGDDAVPRTRSDATADALSDRATPSTGTQTPLSPQQSGPASGPTAHAAAGDGPGHREVLDRQKERFGGIKWGSAFFGWLTATALVLTALAAVGGAAFGLTADPGDPGQALSQVGQAAQNPATVQTAGFISAIVVLVVLLIAYYCGGYVAGRMARFNGLRQGVAVWLWAIIIAALVAALTTVAGSRFNILATLSGLPRLPISEATLTTAGIVATVVALAAGLIGAILGGLAGMRYHRKIDRAVFDD